MTPCRPNPAGLNVTRLALRATVAVSALACFAATPAWAQDDLTPFGRDNLLVTQFDTGVFETDFTGTDSRTVTSLSQTDDVSAPLFDPYGRLFVVNEVIGVVIAYDADFQQLGLFDAENEAVTPQDIAWSAGGHLYIVDAGTGVQEVDVDNDIVRTIGPEHGLNEATAIAVAPNGLLYVSEDEDDEVMVFSPDGGLVRRIGIGTLTDTESLLIHDGLLLVGTRGQGILAFTLAGGPQGTWATAGDAPDVSDLAVGPDGRVWATLRASNDIVAFDDTGAVETTRSGGGEPVGLAFAPWWFRAKLKGQRMDTTDGLTRHIDNDVRLAWWPGPGQLILGLATDSTLSADYGTRVWTFRGLQPDDPAPKKAGVFGAFGISGSPSTQGYGAATGIVRGKLTDDGRFAPKKIRGNLFKATTSTMFQGQVQSRGKPLN